MEKSKEMELIAGFKNLDSYNPEFKKRYSKKPKFEEDFETEQELTQKIPEEITQDEIDESTEETADSVISEAPLSDDVLVMVKIGGIEQEVPLSELKNGYMMQSDYTKKTQELASLKEQYARGLKEATNAIEAFNDNAMNPALKEEERKLAHILHNVDWSKVPNNQLGELMQMKVRYENIKLENEKYQANLDAMRQAMKQENIMYRERLQKEESEKLLECIPDIADETCYADMLDKIRGYLKNRIGEDKVEAILNNMIDHRDVLILRDAMVGNDYLTNKLPKKSVIKPVRRMGNDGIKESTADTSKKTMADRTLRNVKARGERSAATKEELMTILASKIK